MKFIACSFMVARNTLPNLLLAFREEENETWDAAGFKAYSYKWEDIPFIIFVIKEKNKNLILNVMKISNHAIVEGAPTIIAKKKIKMDLIGIAKELSKQYIVKEYNIEVFTWTKHERQALFFQDLC